MILTKFLSEVIFGDQIYKTKQRNCKIENYSKKLLECSRKGKEGERESDFPVPSDPFSHQHRCPLGMDI